MQNTEDKMTLKNQGINIGNHHFMLHDAEKEVTNVTVKDALVEMDDQVITIKLSQIGHVVQGSVKRGKIKDSEIETGTRYLQISNVKDMTPTEIQIGRHIV